MTDTAVLIVAAGRGERAGGAVPKQFALLGGAAVVARAVGAFGDLPVFVVIGAGQEEALASALGGRSVAGVVTGGASRQESVRNGLSAIAAAGGASRVLVHDAARPLLPRAVLEALMAALETHDAAVPVLAVADTLARGDDMLGDTVPRDALYRVQTPQAFRWDALMTSLDRWTGGDATDEAQVVRACGFGVAMVRGDAMLDKITHPQDFARAEAMLASRMISRSATGYDVHRLAEGEELWLGGVKIEHTHGLSGHSDADVALHAITDAVLGCIGAGDIGSHFPPSDAQWRGASSDRFLAHAASLVAARGGIIDFVDLTLICEAPKIGPHREAIRARVADILQVPPRRISIKATTTERLGFTGRGEGIAAQAIATVRVPEDM
ncbi:bifunctional 2-C-methyl-D-erythritol 4-phosphate cytidylyltransferase/2-C-methyl-D-erythritol 2,4-cyclodiphosphate synthase [Sphingomonas sp. SUN039]|uniref:bifunctional 2-C-methyl-D-erythritol 4-phosphate cytidylyltransferase/2-C-methyl-D-erythritol 2,4-cyclodiphosphate synthase n=1 Tax=Sphingomonas sp. SUN039 TaxID=2937787 RepID=UPI002164881D|nr:bifunctional 2-C-methyl-D-erythritol 4-phosphate cytidylyltransferase/2-C-methyl-D-erythritol 2,4-cyclodiphosphate synthase [Sphingomonas sp. SUN039]UVO53515.1 bifunctional 2-C-methyl-D-erythritol 4-phosphate cytidylyltransferase/2-C-methyl-D-erythritol 2,4-cyclodiphosphate synthase [Sphingomonas sp. SUN039]